MEDWRRDGGGRSQVVLTPTRLNPKRAVREQFDQLRNDVPTGPHALSGQLVCARILTIRCLQSYPERGTEGECDITGRCVMGVKCETFEELEEFLRTFVNWGDPEGEFDFGGVVCLLAACLDALHRNVPHADPEDFAAYLDERQLSFLRRLCPKLEDPD